MKELVSKTAIAAAAAGAAVSVGSMPALADQAGVTEPDWFLSLEGSLLFADPAIDKLGSGGPGPGIAFDFNDFDKDLGYRGAAAFGKKFDDNLDWRLGVAYSNFVKNNASLSITGIPGSGSGSGSLLGTGEADFSYLTADLELGYNVRPGDDFDLRVFGGLRFLNSRDSQDKFGEFESGGSGGTIQFGADSEFIGVGPRAGLDFSSRLGEGNFGFSGMIATAVLYGDLKQKFEANGSGLGSSFSGFSETLHENELLFNLEAAFGADFHLNENAVLTIGYRGEYWNDVRFSDKIGGSGETPDTLSHGPFVRFIAKF
ncbi:MAG: Lpg1974 family pore-forming outer membrane protein [Aestuariivirga sp.]